MATVACMEDDKVVWQGQELPGTSSYESLRDKWAGTGLFGHVLASSAQALAERSAGKVAPALALAPLHAEPVMRGSACASNKPPPTPAVAPFTKLVSRGVNLVDRINKNAIVYTLAEGGIVLRINKVFVKRVLVLRMHAPNSIILDQDDWPVAVPFHQFARVEERLRSLANNVGVPVFTITHCDMDPASFTHTGVTRDCTTATLEMPAGTGILKISWARASARLTEELIVWSALEAASDNTAVLASCFLRSHPSARKQLRDAATWVMTRASGVFVIVHATSIEGQAIASEAWPELSKTNRAAILLVPSVVVDPISSHGGAAAGYSTALALHQVFGSSEDAHVAFVDANVWPNVSELILPVIREHLAPPRPEMVLSFPRDALSNADEFLSKVQSAYCNSRPYVHSFIGAGAAEAEISEAVEGAIDKVSRLQKILGTAVPPPTFATIEAALPHQAGLRQMPPAQRARKQRRTLLPIGRGAVALADLVEKRLCNQWRIDCSEWQTDCLAVVDFTDTEVLPWFRRAQARAETDDGPWCVHMLALLPAAKAPHTQWETTAAPLAMAMSGDVLDLGLAVCASLESGCKRLLTLLEAISTVRLHDIAFQLRPRPRAGLAFAANQLLENDELLTLAGDTLAFGDVLASFSMWPTACLEATVEVAGLLPATYLQPGLPPDVARAGVSYESCLIASGAAEQKIPSSYGIWHFCTSEETEAALYRRAAGDFEGREAGDFEWQGEEDGPQARLWELAAEIWCPAGETGEGAAAENASEMSSASRGPNEALESSRISSVSGEPSGPTEDAPPRPSETSQPQETPRGSDDVEASGSYGDSDFCSEHSAGE